VSAAGLTIEYPTPIYLRITIRANHGELGIMKNLKSVIGD
jgi:hypothetical protein